MMAAVFLSYAAVIWLIFEKLRLIRLSLPLALVLAAVGPIFAFYVVVSMNNFHPSSPDQLDQLPVLQRLEAEHKSDVMFGGLSVTLTKRIAACLLGAASTLGGFAPVIAAEGAGTASTCSA